MASTRAALRLLAGVLSVLAGILAAILVIAATGGPDLAGLVIAAACLILGIAGASVARTGRAPLRPMRLTAALGLPIALYMMAALPWPPRGADLGSFLTLAIGATLTGAALVIGARWPRITSLLLTPPAVYGAVLLGRFGRHLTTRREILESAGPAITLAFVLAGSLGVAWMMALWHARVLWAAPPTPPGRRAT